MEKALLSDIAPSALRGTVIGMHAALVGVALLPASFIAGILWDNFGAQAPFYFGAGMGLLAVIGLLFIFKDKKTGSNKEYLIAGGNLCLHNPLLLSALLSTIAAQIPKIPVYYWVHRSWNWRAALKPGGMPSSHTALMVGLTTATLLKYGWNNPSEVSHPIT